MLDQHGQSRMGVMPVARAACPECGREIDLEQHVKKGDWITCPYCKVVDIEVISLDPPLLDWAYEGPELAGFPWPWRGGPGWRR